MFSDLFTRVYLTKLITLNIYFIQIKHAFNLSAVITLHNILVSFTLKEISLLAGGFYRQGHCSFIIPYIESRQRKTDVRRSWRFTAVIDIFFVIIVRHRRPRNDNAYSDEHTRAVSSYLRSLCIRLQCMHTVLPECSLFDKVQFHQPYLALSNT